MRTTALTVGLAACANLVSAMAFTAPTQCLTMKDAAEKLDISRWIDLWMETTCKRCQSPKLSDYPTSLREGFVVPFMKTSSEKMETPHLSSDYVTLIDSLLDMAKTDCNAKDSDDLCDNPDQFKSVAKCVQSKAWKSILRNPGAFLNILLADPCGKQMKFITDSDSLDSAIRSHLTEYEKTCPKISESLDA
ncbi:hypothetical protein BDV27DRAFT_154101 [Aspergillus caelatus]|uniref:Saposin B-type domain-containing protein n=2 Tax=Aspergillus subgen. Circumdati TaxID=2720871 RepID=A0A5N7AEU8_9EURO|nr:uncharacterized protein BDV27DRAFT_154101 [Aspergillus caelatus]KAE8368394.1 hypothetical protein BDV27DRAFT_154101 [Aspergillus caelatus]KAE8422669.1 hypothetical protein BDV36DRAFT_291170 [Aspergillus pseudocaelatus]